MERFKQADMRAVAITGGVAGGIVLIGVLFWLALLLFDWLSPEDAQDRIDLVLAFAQMAGGLILLGGLYYTSRTVRHSQETLKNQRETLKYQQKSTEDQRFFDASKLLFEEASEGSHIGALYTLEQLAKDSPVHYEQVIEVICAFVRHRSQRDRPSRAERDALMSMWEEAKRKAEAYNNAKRPPLGFSVGPRDYMEFPTAAHDIQIAMTILARREKRFHEGETQGLDLRGAHLSGMVFGAADFRGASFQNAIAINTGFIGTNLERTSFSDADLRFARLRLSPLDGSWFRKADVRLAQFRYEGPIERVARSTRKKVAMEVKSASVYLTFTFWMQALMDGAEFWCDDMRGMIGIPKEQYESMVVHTPNHEPPDFEDRVMWVEKPRDMARSIRIEDDEDDSI